MSKIWLDVPFAEKDQAKLLGARWDVQARRWFATKDTEQSLARWLAVDLPETLPGEDRSLGCGLFVDLVPETCWFTNVRSCVSARDWERLRRMVVERASRTCEICSALQRPDLPMEVHERWIFDEEAGRQVLGRLLCLCTACHEVTHFGLAQVHHRGGQALSHLMAVTGKSRQEAEKHVAEAFRLWERRSSYTWTLQLDLLKGVGITVTPPPAALQRSQVAARRLRQVRSR